MVHMRKRARLRPKIAKRAEIYQVEQCFQKVATIDFHIYGLINIEEKYILTPKNYCKKKSEGPGFFPALLGLSSIAEEGRI